MDNTAYAIIMTMLKQSKLSFWLHDHPEVGTIDEAHERVPHLTKNLIKTVVFRIRERDWILAAVLGRKRIDYKSLANAISVNRKELISVSPADVKHELGFEIGGVGPFPVHPSVTVIFDEGLISLGCVFCGSGINTQTIEIEIQDLVALTSGKVYPISK